ncbi:MAG TPA: zinc ribbon domain-containing protein [Bacilli bacterium]|nr:zinc ribbon domain-containing protein [Bacilli bacterium]HQC83885.1 zinc ribbon domain-containing protein [Bacilli bacterium]
MKCVNCGADLIEGNNICPKCGALNMAFVPKTNTSAISDVNNANTTNSNVIVDIDDDVDTPSPQVNASTVAPSLNVIDDISAEVNAADLSSAAGNASTYAPGTVIEEEKHEAVKKDDVVIATPEVKQAVTGSEAPLDGSIPVLKGETATAGSVNTAVVSPSNINVKKSFISGLLKRKFPFMVMVISCIVLFIVGLLLGMTMFSTITYSPSSSKTSSSSTTLTYISNGKNNTTKSGNYTYTIPTAYNYDKYNGGILVYDEKGTFRMYIKDASGTYDNIANAKSSIKATLVDNNYGVNNIKETTIGDIPYVTVEITELNYNRLIALRSGSNNDIFYIEIYAPDNSYNYDVLSVANDIISNAKYNENELSIEHVSIKDVSKLISTTADAFKSLQS